MNRYQIERLRRLEILAQLRDEERNFDDKPDDVEIMQKHLHLTNIEASEELLRRLVKYHGGDNNV